MTPRFAVVLALFALAACRESVKPPEHHLLVSVTSDGRAPVPGAQITINGKPAGTTADDGEVASVLRQPEGTSLELAVTCPTGFQSGPPQRITLRTLAQLEGSTAAPPLRERLLCTPTQRELVLVVNAGQPGIPIMVDGTPRGETNELGVAHTLLAAEPGATFQVTLDTSQHPKLRPQNPARSFALGSEDSVTFFQQEFKQDKPRVRRKSKPQGPKLPYRIE